MKGFEEGTERLVLSHPEQPIVTALWDGGMLVRPIASEGAVVGRSIDADVVIDHRSVSRRHARLHLTDQLFVEDLGSANGTRVRGRLLSPDERVLVEWGEPIEVGTSVVIARAGSAANVTGGRPLAAMDRAEGLIELVAPTNISVLITGETGVGKGYLAKMVHEKSKRHSGPWLHLNCAALPEPLLESELFGHERGSFTGAHAVKPGLFESASGGTVFLDEVGDLPLSTQAKLLLAIEKQEVLRIGALRPRTFDVRLVSATSKPIGEAHPDRFRTDLYYRLAGLIVEVPPLRTRSQEIPILFRQFLYESSERLEREVPTVSSDALATFVAHDWPGNVRELASAVERALLFSGATMGREQAVLAIGHKSTVKGKPAPHPEIADPEHRRVLDALAKTAGNQSAAAALLGVSRRTLINRMIQFDIARPRKR